MIQAVPTLTWGVLIGEAVHNLRSALDQLMWQLAIAHLGCEPTEDEARSIHFPAAKTGPDFKSVAVLRFISPDHAKLLKGFQPFHQRGHDPAGHPLAILTRLSNHDKHRVVQTSFAALADFRVEIEVVRDCEIIEIERPPPGIAFEQDTELARVKGRNTGPNPEFDGHGQLTGYIAFSDGTGRVIEVLDRVLASAREVLDAFKNEV